MFGIILQFNNNCQAIRQMERRFYSMLQQLYIQRGCSKLSAIVLNIYMNQLTKRYYTVIDYCAILSNSVC